jgi:hypothetical protein
MARARRLTAAVEMPELFDMQAIQLGARRLSVALASGRIDQRTARLMNFGLQMSVNVLRLMDWQANLKSNRLYQIPTTAVNSRGYRKNTA